MPHFIILDQRCISDEKVPKKLADEMTPNLVKEKKTGSLNFNVNAPLLFYRFKDLLLKQEQQHERERHQPTHLIVSSHRLTMLCCLDSSFVPQW